MYGFVYLTTNLKTGMKYVGMCKNTHRDRYLGSGKNLKEAIKTYGRESFSREILEECESFEDLTAAEKKWVAHLNADSDSSFYNIYKGGYGGCSESMKDYWSQFSSEERKLVRKWGKPWKGKSRPKSKSECKALSEKASKYWKSMTAEERKVSRNWHTPTIYNGAGNPKAKACVVTFLDGRVEKYECLKDICAKYPGWKYSTLKGLARKKSKSFDNKYEITITYGKF